ncbi:hypothetical protein THAOC_35887, partial [Thalassiosira oceanica]
GILGPNEQRGRVGAAVGPERRRLSCVFDAWLRDRGADGPPALLQARHAAASEAGWHRPGVAARGSQS